MNKGKKNWTYYTDFDDFTRYVRDEFFKAHKLLHVNRRTPFTKADLTSLIVANNNYDAVVDTIATNNSIFQVLLEDIMILVLKKAKFQEYKKVIEKKYPYLKVTQQKGTIVFDGIANDVSHLFVLNQNLIHACQPILSYLSKSEKQYIIDGHKIGLYELIKFYRESEPKNIERAKGLGSLKDFEIGRSTLDPGHRKLIRYTVKDIEEEIEDIRRVNDDQYTLIKDLDISQYEF